ncbi:MAG: hypothetical protein KJ989_21145 [Gammaproteobacteria bacterium]|nr:hypothetical protein [Gammaproteobacteria bacterium]MBU2156415.1 hypothetical protein [Gammaproteobacteria bacterium]MBU2255487.1 hypothetical protein [Gammaproteobacteria bacterium]MBU2296695.1 hypothetical protein [Gammaproteobacteria bacterium]
MRRMYKSCLLVLGLLGVSQLLQAAPDVALNQVQLAQVQVFRASTDLFIHRGEGGHTELATKVQNDLSKLRESLATLQAQPMTDSARLAIEQLQPPLAAFIAMVEQTLAYNPSEPDLPWEFNFQYSKAQRELVAALEALEQQLLKGLAQPLPAADLRLQSLPAKVQYLAARYTARAYVGDIETLPEQQQDYLNQDIDVLAKQVDAELASLATELIGEQQQRLQRAQTRWKFIYPRLVGYSDNLVPLVVERHAAEMADQLLRLRAK